MYERRRRRHSIRRELLNTIAVFYKHRYFENHRFNSNNLFDIRFSSVLLRPAHFRVLHNFKKISSQDNNNNNCLASPTCEQLLIRCSVEYHLLTLTANKIFMCVYIYFDLLLLVLIMWNILEHKRLKFIIYDAFYNIIDFYFILTHIHPDT